MGFNDLGWLGADVGLVDTMKRFVDNARAANPNVRIVLANAPTAPPSATPARGCPSARRSTTRPSPRRSPPGPPTPRPSCSPTSTARWAATPTRPRAPPPMTGCTPTRWASTASPKRSAPPCTMHSGSAPGRSRCPAPCPPGRWEPPPT
ncbi:hypothetical protein [Streptomyces sp. PSKA30]|uniref:hypothetical protein n=1 Tax=Streptomyces sp. PSKA30 TaxID=2874597 RepID=UPI001CD0F9D7|nr:hypothetical protein [Streptomyces sp. PSKA30]